MHSHDTTAPEEWRAVIGYERWYSVSNLGRVRREAGGQGARAGHLCKHHLCKKGYHRVALIIKRQHKSYAVHRLVAAAFLRPPLNGEQVNHKNGIKGDNRPENLEWCTQDENMAHASANGLRPDCRGEKNGHAILSDVEVDEVRTLRGHMRQIDIDPVVRHQSKSCQRHTTGSIS